jgi:hypothetical protein
MESDTQMAPRRALRGTSLEPASETGSTPIVPDGAHASLGASAGRASVRGSRVRCLGHGSIKQLEYELTPDGIDLGLDAALPTVIDLGHQIGEFGRGERIWGARSHASDCAARLDRQRAHSRRVSRRAERRQATLQHLNVTASLPLEIEVTGRSAG